MRIHRFPDIHYAYIFSIYNTVEWINTVDDTKSKINKKSAQLTIADRCASCLINCCMECAQRCSFVSIFVYIAGFQHGFI